jgi:hypothetical protein
MNFFSHDLQDCHLYLNIVQIHFHKATIFICMYGYSLILIGFIKLLFKVIKINLDMNDLLCFFCVDHKSKMTTMEYIFV